MSSPFGLFRVAQGGIAGAVSQANTRDQCQKSGLFWDYVFKTLQILFWTMSSAKKAFRDGSGCLSIPFSALSFVCLCMIAFLTLQNTHLKLNSLLSET